MKWGAFIGTLAIVTVIFFLQSPKMKQYPKKDKAIFIALLLLGLTLSLFDLQQMPGPASWVSALLKPFGKFMEH